RGTALWSRKHEPVNKIVAPNTLPSYREQSSAVRARFTRLKQREVILKVDQLTKIFNDSNRSTLALNKISFETHRREFLCVVGPSGGGKSTLVRNIAGLEDTPRATCCLTASQRPSREATAAWCSKATRCSPGSP